MGIPLIGIGLFYGQGYFRQRLDGHGWQQEEYLETTVSHMPMEPAIGTGGEPVTIQIDTRSGLIRAKVWRVKVGGSTSFFWIRMSKETLPKIGNSLPVCTEATGAFVSARNYCWASEVSEH